MTLKKPNTNLTQFLVILNLLTRNQARLWSQDAEDPPKRREKLENLCAEAIDGKESMKVIALGTNLPTK